MKKTLFGLIIVVISIGCGRRSSKTSDTEDLSPILTQSDLLPPDVIALDADDLSSELRSRAELFEYQKSPLISLALSFAKNCADEFFDKHPIKASPGRASFRMETDEEFEKCWIKLLREAFEKAAQQQSDDSLIKITPVDSNSSKSSKERCETGENTNYASYASGLRNQVSIEMLSSEDLTHLDGVSIREVKKVNGYPFPVSNLRTIVQQKSPIEGEGCRDRKYFKFSGESVLQEKCSLSKDNQNSKANCSMIDILRISKIEEGSISLQELHEKHYDNEYVTFDSHDIIHPIGNDFPTAGKKSVTLGNWMGEIKFGKSEPSYEFKDSKDGVVSGIFVPRS